MVDAVDAISCDEPGRRPDLRRLTTRHRNLPSSLKDADSCTEDLSYSPYVRKVTTARLIQAPWLSASMTLHARVPRRRPLGGAALSLCGLSVIVS